MGRYINTGFDGFKEITRSKYVDKTGIIALVNDRINTIDKLICISRPRRFGKSFAAKTLCAYYDCSADSHELFDKYEIARAESYEEHINKYNVICLDISEFISAIERENREYTELTEDISSAILNDIYAAYKDMPPGKSLTEALEIYSGFTGKPYVFILDEWDCVIRETDTITQNKYLSMLRELFKSTRFTPKYVAAAYMTGILPIKKIKSQSAISDFKEYSVLAPGRFAGFIGFNEQEIKAICNKYDMDLDKMKWWYDGYTFGNVSEIYNPYSVMNAVDSGVFASYWRQTSAAESLRSLIELDYDGLQKSAAELISGEEILVNTSSFKNDIKDFSDKDDVLSLMIHLGYLTYNNDTGCARIPNEELRTEFNDLLKTTRSTKLIAFVSRSKQILNDTFEGNEQAVADAVDKIREENYAPMFYNNEQSLRSAVKLAYLAAVENYVKIEELPSGKGLADIVYLPQRGSAYPALIIELKWNRTEKNALEQIRQRNYPAVLKDFGGDILLVGINYDDNEKKHRCKIERIIN